MINMDFFFLFHLYFIFALFCVHPINFVHSTMLYLWFSHYYCIYVYKCFFVHAFRGDDRDSVELLFMLFRPFIYYCCCHCEGWQWTIFINMFRTLWFYILSNLNENAHKFPVFGLCGSNMIKNGNTKYNDKWRENVFLTFIYKYFNGFSN